jgi:hypothetical protein
MAFQEAGGHWWQLDLSGPFIDAAWFGVHGDGTDQTTALQAAINACPAEGGEIQLRGIAPNYQINVSAINLSSKNNIRLIGCNGSGNGVGGGQRTQLRLTTTGSATAINCIDTNNVSFVNLFIRATDAGFAGKLIDYGISSSGSAFMSIDNCILTSAGTNAATLLSLYGATNGVFTNVNFQGLGYCVLMQVTGGVVNTNNHLFSGCTFHPGSQVPVVGAGEGITFQSCCFQASYSDGQAKAYLYVPGAAYNGLSFIGCTFYDVINPGGVWINAGWGNGLLVTGCRFGGGSGSYGIFLGGGGGGSDPQTKGCRGNSIMANVFDGFSAAISFAGTIAAKTNARATVIGGNTVTTGTLLTGYSTAEQLILLPNSIYSAPNQFGANLAFQGLGEFADGTAAAGAGYTTGQVYCISGTRHLAMV